MNDDIDDGPITASSGTIALLNASEIDQQITTAHKYPRSVAKFRKSVEEMVTLSEAIAAECIYSLPRDGKVIEGPSARFAEVVASAWGNSRAGARVVSDEGDFVTAQGVFHDLERNVAITYEVQRRIVNKEGKRFKPDMIGVTANAACSIALRNSILKGIPKAFWVDMYEGAKLMAKGNVATLPNRRAEAFKMFQGYGVTKEQIFAKLAVQGEADIGVDQLLTLRGLLNAIKEGDTTPEQAFDSGDAKPATNVQRKSASGPTVGDAAAAVASTTGESPVDVLRDAVAKARQVDRIDAGTGEITRSPADGPRITANQAKYLSAKFVSIEAGPEDIAKMLARFGGTTIEMLTPDQFEAVKLELIAVGA